MSNRRLTLARIGASAMAGGLSTEAVAQPASPSAAKLPELLQETSPVESYIHVNSDLRLSPFDKLRVRV